MPMLVALVVLGCEDGEPSDSGTDAGCAPGARCSGDELCFGQRCERISEWTVRLAAPEARSCDALIELEAGSRFVAARWTDGVEGHAEARHRLLGLAFISAADSALAAEPVRITATGKPPRVRQATCADRTGRPLPKSNLRVSP